MVYISLFLKKHVNPLRILRGGIVGVFVCFTAHANTRDAETENALKVFATPFVNVMGLKDRNITYRLNIAPEFNAMVTGGDNVFFNSGLILDLDTAEEFMAVSAHELAHIKSDDLQKVGKAHAQAQHIAKVTTIAGIVSAVAGQDTQTGIAGASLGNQLADRSLKQHIRTQEKSADAYAFQAFQDLGMGLGGHISIQKKLLNKGGYVTKQQSYTMTHPTSLERLRQAQSIHEKSPYKNVPPDPKKQRLFERIQAKLFGYIKQKSIVLAKYPPTDTSDIAIYARAMNAFANNDTDTGITHMRVLVKRHPTDIYYLESLAMLLYKSKEHAEAIKIYKKILKHNRTTDIFYVDYARNLIQIGDKASLNEAEWALHRAKNLNKSESYTFKTMMNLYRVMDKQGKLFLAEAEYAYILGQENAKVLAQKAQNILAKGTPEYIRAGDIIKALP